ncbi:MAG: hypothetical protein K2N60_04440 [Oscillospiraceae bacterium]|nr:hypothetical protein [Oscillospiraceae bacterium]
MKLLSPAVILILFILISSCAEVSEELSESCEVIGEAASLSTVSCKVPQEAKISADTAENNIAKIFSI